jgi:predicted ArsR family transcriptional regulator
MGEDARRDTRRDTRRRLSVPEAADALGVTVDAVRSRIKRGTIAHERKGGRVYVLLSADESRPGQDQYTDQGGEQGGREPEDRTAELIATLREQLQAERQAHAEARRIIAGLVERMPPAIEAPPDERDAPEAAASGAEGVSPRPGPTPSQESVQRRPWWRRVFGS